ncbi:S24 family peptidase [Corallibacter sp.]|uniref:S24 family peptidase n=1 Tax=Corallibacter sp. TaxID=2038084 RepID=UPI003A929F51
MSKIVTRIKEYLDAKNIAVSKAETTINVSNGTLSKAISNDKSIKTETLEKFLMAFPDFSITGDKPNYLENNLKASGNQESQLPKLITVDHEGNENTIFVPVQAQAGYINGFGDPDYISQLPTYRLPRLNNGTFRMFEVKGHSMNPTLHDKCIVVGEWVENWNDIKDNQIYVVLTEDGLVVKRVINRLQKYGNLFLKSDNRSEYPSYAVNHNEIREVWKVNLAMLFNLLDPSTIFDRINDLEADVLMLRQNISKK